MRPLYVVGGRQKANVDDNVEEWHHYAAGVVVSVDPDTGSVEKKVDYVSPPEVCPDESPSIVFKTASLVGDRMYVPTQTEVLVYEVPSFEQVGYVSIPAFNDVHHVRPGENGSLLIANTGLDMVLEVSAEGEVLREWSTIGEELWTRFSRDVDYRKVSTTKPHRSHPNHVWFLDDELWVTRCDQKDALCLTRDEPAVPVSDRWIHDGLLFNGRVHFTSVDGHVVVVDGKTREVVGRYDLNRISGADSTIGWCRGIEVMDDDHVVVGFSRLRPTKWKKNIEWVVDRVGVKKVYPTRIAMFDLRNEKLCWEVDLEPAGVNVVFSIHAAEG